MKILLIRTDHPEAELYIYEDEVERSRSIWQADRALAESLLRKIDQLCNDSNLQLKDIEAIGVFAGPGSFTGLRIGHSVANSLAYSLNVPIVSAGGDGWQVATIGRLMNGADDQIVTPSYGHPVHITKPKK